MIHGLAERYERARAAFDMRSYTTAARELAEIVEAVPQQLDARLLLARAYYHSAQLHRAETQLREIIDQAPDDAYAHLMLGRTLQRQSRHDDATGPLRLAAALDPGLVEG